eukprot:1160446-Pelagomonas_calceolata.AAC.6
MAYDGSVPQQVALCSHLLNSTSSAPCNAALSSPPSSSLSSLPSAALLSSSPSSSSSSHMIFAINSSSSSSSSSIAIIVIIIIIIITIIDLQDPIPGCTQHCCLSGSPACHVLLESALHSQNWWLMLAHSLQPCFFTALLLTASELLCLTTHCPGG